jgi:hypothetical protein
MQNLIGRRCTLITPQYAGPALPAGHSRRSVVQAVPRARVDRRLLCMKLLKS